MALRRDQTTLLLASVASLAVAIVPILRPIALPLVYLNTHIHELCHALVAIATGGQVEKILVFANGSGVTPIFGSMMFLTASAGYVGSSIVGGVILAGSRSPKAARRMVMIALLFLVLSLIFFLRGDLIGLGSALFWIALLGAGTKWFPDKFVLPFSQFIGIQIALNSLGAFMVLIKISAATENHSDALIMQQITGIPSIVWALGWLIFGLMAIGAGLYSAWRPKSGSKSAD